MLSDDARKVIAGQSEEYTWTDENGLDKEMDGMTILALILWCLRPHYKVDMYSEIGAIKQMTIVQYDEDINLFFDSIKSVKLQIDSKDPNAYTDEEFFFVIYSFRSRMSCFITTSSPSLLLSKGVGRWTRNL